MKKTALFAMCIVLGLAAQAQITSKQVNDAKRGKPPKYVSDAVIPDFSVISFPDSTAFANKDLKKHKPTVLMIFSPKCGHCKLETKLVEKNIEHFKNAQILMVTWLPYNTLDEFARDFNIADFPEITLAWDPNDFMYGYYEVHRFPKFVVYDKNGRFVKAFEEDYQIKDVYTALGGE